MRWIAGLLCVAFLGVWTAPLLAQGQAPGAAQEEFVPVSPDELDQEQLPAAPLVFAAYAFVWFALVTYVFVLWRRLTQVERELAQLSARLPPRHP
jgi:CcmD family protein